jgi:proteasome accessory factor A
MWSEAIDQLWKDPSALFDKCDWVAKHRIVEEYQAKKGVGLQHPKLAMIDLMYHDTDRSRGLYYRLERNHMMARTTTDEAIAHAQEHPPETTRARLRGAFVKRAKERRRDYTVDWVHLKLNDQAQRTVMLKDPFISHDDRVQRLIDSL